MELLGLKNEDTRYQHVWKIPAIVTNSLRYFYFKWICSHSGKERNETANELSKEATNISNHEPQFLYYPFFFSWKTNKSKSKGINIGQMEHSYNV